MTVRQSAITGAILGTAVGDALGLPYEGLSARRAAKLLGEPDRHRLFLRRGMVSDDTEHACMTMQALVAAGDDVDRFTRELAKRLRWWLVAMPAGAGLATVRATLRLWRGVRPEASGVFSAGNGPAMRSPVIGAAIEDLELLARFVRASTRLTHSDPKAEYGAMAVALAARIAADEGGLSAETFAARLGECLCQPEAAELRGLADRAAASARRGETTEAFAAELGLRRGVSGYIYHTVPVVLQAAMRHAGDFRQAVRSVIRCGGDADSTAAIVGGIVGSGVGKEGIPREWLDGLWEWPRTVGWMERLAEELCQARNTGRPSRPPRLAAPATAARNVFFLAVVLTHGFRRVLPPYG